MTLTIYVYVNVRDSLTTMVWRAINSSLQLTPHGAIDLGYQLCVERSQVVLTHRPNQCSLTVEWTNWKTFTVSNIRRTLVGS